MATDTAPRQHFFFDSDHDRPVYCDVAGGQAALYSKRGPDKNGANEDAAAVFPVAAQAGVLVVADGMGGTPAGEQAAVLAIKAVESSLDGAGDEQMMLRTAILNGFESANLGVRALGVGAGATVAAVEIVSDSVRPYHVGDAMILVTGQRGKIKLQTVSHSPVGYAVEAGVLDEDEAMHHEDRHIVSNMVGAADMRIEIGSAIELAQRDTLLLASDGLFDNLLVEEIVERIRKGSLRKAAERLAADARQRMLDSKAGYPSKPDDLTFILFRPGVERRKKKRL